MEDQIKIAFERFNIPHLKENLVLEKSKFIQGYYSKQTNKFHLFYDDRAKVYQMLSHHVAAMLQKHPDTNSIILAERKLILSTTLSTALSLILAPRLPKSSISIGLTSLFIGYFSAPITVFYNNNVGFAVGLAKLVDVKDYESIAYGSLFSNQLTFKLGLFMAGHKMKRDFDQTNINFTFSPIFRPSQKTKITIDYPTQEY